MSSKKILITGGCGQIGLVLVRKLRQLYGASNVVLTDMRNAQELDVVQEGPFYQLDVTDGNQIEEIVNKEKITTIYHLAALLSGRCEEVPQLAWNINLGGLQNVLEVAKKHKCQVFNPSTIGVFGRHYDQDNTIQNSVLRPTSIYGITKVTSELLCDYYHQKFDVDTRGVRYPGVLSSVILGGGTTDYAVYMHQSAVKNETYDCFLLPDTRLDMMYIDDAVDATIQLMNSDPAKLIHRNAFNITAMNFTPNELFQNIKKHYPEFNVTYNNIDPIKQAIADTWPNSMCSQTAQQEWGFSPKYDMEGMTRRLISDLLNQEKETIKEKEQEFNPGVVSM